MERLRFAQQAAGLSENKQQLTADVLKLQQQLESAHAALADSQQQVLQLQHARDRLQVQVWRMAASPGCTAAPPGRQPQSHCIGSSPCRVPAMQAQSAVAEYRANDIIAVGLRDHITRLQQELRDSQHTCSQQVRIEPPQAGIAGHSMAVVALCSCHTIFSGTPPM